VLELWGRRALSQYQTNNLPARPRSSSQSFGSSDKRRTRLPREQGGFATGSSNRHFNLSPRLKILVVVLDDELDPVSSTFPHDPCRLWDAASATAPALRTRQRGLSS
jgi:hypothetical protein